GGDEDGFGIAVDDTGNAYVTGDTTSINFPTTTGTAQPAKGGGDDAFVTKLDATGSMLLYSTYLGGSGTDVGTGIAVDDTGRAYVTGDTYSTDFPTTPGAAQTANAGVDDAFVTRLDATGSARLYSTYLGGSDSDFGQGIALDGAGSAYVTGQTFSTNFPTTAGAFQTAHAPDSGNVDAFVAKIEFVRPPATLTLAPAAAINVVHTQHCVTATVQDALGNPTPGIEVHFSVTGTTTTGGVVTTDRSGRATFCYIGATRAGADTITAFADTNDNDALDPGEPVGVAAKTWIAGAPAALVLAPATATNTVGAQHCVTATVTDAFGNPTPNVTVRATVTGTVRTSATGTTNAAGQFQFCYTSSLLGADAITAFADTNNNGKQDAGEPSGAATKTWVLPAGLATGCKVSGEGVLRTANGDRAAFEGDARSQTTGVVSGQQEYQDFGPARPVRVRSINVRALVQEGPTRVSVYGQATVNGAGSFAYRVTFDDQSGPGGHKDKYSILVSNGYASGEEIIQSGDIEVTCGLPDGDGRGHKDEEDHQGVKDRDGKHGGR
ncbi:MAG TPA: Ig-like domain-containing protein, partial [Vicinamibacterales bacterium]|nr:Ig-like domain-containing protein [Vicinamibacterales bacterium]